MEDCRRLCSPSCRLALDDGALSSGPRRQDFCLSGGQRLPKYILKNISAQTDVVHVNDQTIVPQLSEDIFWPNIYEYAHPAKVQVVITIEALKPTSVALIRN